MFKADPEKNLMPDLQFKHNKFIPSFYQIAGVTQFPPIILMLGLFVVLDIPVIFQAACRGISLARKRMRRKLRERKYNVNRLLKTAGETQSTESAAYCTSSTDNKVSPSPLI